MNPAKEISVENHPNDQANNYLLLISLNEYNSDIQNLHNPVDDAKALKECLLNKYQFKAEHCIELFDAKATRKNIIATFDQLENQLTEADNLVFFYSGHGSYNKNRGNGYWVVADSNEGDRSSYLPHSEILEFTKSLKAKHVLGIIDSCFSGAIYRETKIENSGARFYNLNSRYFLTSGREEPVPDGTPGLHSPFCGGLLELLRKNIKPILWATDLCGLLRDNLEVKPGDPTFRGDSLHGNYGHKGGEFAFLMNGSSIINTSEKTSYALSNTNEKIEEINRLKNRRSLKTFQRAFFSIIIIFGISLLSILFAKNRFHPIELNDTSNYEFVENNRHQLPVIFDELKLDNSYNFVISAIAAFLNGESDKAIQWTQAEVFQPKFSELKTNTNTPGLNQKQLAYYLGVAGAIRELANLPVEASEFYTEAEMQDSTDSWLLRKIGQFYDTQSQEKTALSYFNKALRHASSKLDSIKLLVDIGDAHRIRMEYAKAEAVLNEAKGQFENIPFLQREDYMFLKARIYRSLGLVLGRYNEILLEENYLNKAIILLKELIKSKNRNDYRHLYGVICYQKSPNSIARVEFAEAIQNAEIGVAELRKLRNAPDSLKYLSDLVGGLTQLAISYYADDYFKDAKKAILEAEQLVAKLYFENRKKFQLSYLLTQVIKDSILGGSYETLKNQKNTLTDLQIQLNFEEEHPSRIKDLIALVLQNQALREDFLFRDLDKENTPILYMEEAIRIYQSLKEESPEAYDDNIGGAYSSMGLIYNSLGQFDTALNYSYKTLEVYQTLYDKNSGLCYTDIIATKHKNIADIYHTKYHPNFDSAFYHFQKSIVLYKSLNKGRAIQNGLAEAKFGFARVYNAKNDRQKGYECAQEGLSLLKQLFDADSANYVKNYATRLSLSYSMYNNPNEGIKQLKEGIRLLTEICKEDFDNYSLQLAHSYYFMEHFYSDSSHLQQMELLQKALYIVEERERKNLDKTPTYDTKAQVFWNIGNLKKNIAEYDSTLYYYQKSLDINKQKLKNNRDVDGSLRFWIASNYSSIAMVYSLLENSDEALNYYEQALRIYQELNQILSIKYSQSYVLFLGSYANFLQSQQQSKKAIEFLKEAYAIQVAELKETPSAPLKLSNLATILSNFGSIYLSKNDYTKARNYYKEYKVAAEKASRLDNNYLSLLANAHQNLGEIDRLENDYLSQESHYKKALAINLEIVQKKPSNILGLISIQSALSSLLLTSHKYSEADLLLDSALINCHQAEGLNATYASYTLESLHLQKGLNAYYRNNFQEAPQWIKKVYDGKKLKYKDNPKEHCSILANFSNNMGFVLLKKKEYEQAEHYLLQSVSLYTEYKNNTEKENIYSVYPLTNLGLLYAIQGDTTKAEKYLNQANELIEKLIDKPSDTHSSEQYYVLATTGKAWLWNHPQKALPYLQKALKLQESLFAKNGKIHRPALTNILVGSAKCNILLQEHKTAMRQLDLASRYIHDFVDKEPDAFNSMQARIQKLLGDCSNVKGVTKQTKEHYNISLKIYEEQYIIASPKVFAFEYAELLEAMHSLEPYKGYHLQAIKAIDVYPTTHPLRRRFESK